MSVNQKHPARWLPALVLLVFAFSAAPALASSPVLTVNTISLPTNLPPGGEGEIQLQISNLGDAPANGETSPIAIAEKLPPGLVATAISGAECELETLHCVYKGILQPYTELRLNITVKVDKNASTAPGGLVNEVVLNGGGAALTTTRHALTVSPTPAPFGVEDLRLVPTNEDGSIDTQAGSHPFQLTATIAVNTLPGSQPVALTKDLHFSLPPGLIGNTQTIPQCTSQEFDESLPGGLNACPAETAIGTVILHLTSNVSGAVPLFNLVPSVGEPARFGITLVHVPVILDTALRTGGDYGAVASVNNISQVFGFLGSQVTFWGVPADPSHNNVRGWGCLWKTVYGYSLPCVAPARPRLIPFLTLPTSCSGPGGMRTTVEADSWSEPGVFARGESLLEDDSGGPLGLVGCNRLPFEPSIGIAPDGSAASTPSGLTVGVHVPQVGALNPTGLAPSEMRGVAVALPVGMQVSPAGGDGLEACSLGEIGLEEGGDPLCPDGSKVATVEVKTPLLPNPLGGEVYLAAQNANPFGSLIAMYIVVKDPVSGVLVKLAGQVGLDPVSGQLLATFKDTPQLPFEDLTMHFFGSARAPLTTPALCGSYAATASFTPWSGNAAANVVSPPFQIVSGPGGAPCADPAPFAPGFQAGSTNLQAGAFTPFTLTMSRPDADQALSRVEMRMPAGLLGTLSTVKLCGEPQASQGTCGAESLIGETTVSAGLGSEPFTVAGGKVYITTAYGGGQYGLAIVNPVKAGPFDLEDTPENHPACDCIVVRASVSVDPHTAALDVRSDALPTILDGIPLQIQHVNVTVNRPGFTFNPTSCARTAIHATLSSTQGATAPVSTPFQVTNCEKLRFAPKFAVSTKAKTTKKNGASLHVALSFPHSGPQGGSQAAEANIRSVRVTLPAALPARLTTLQKACTAAQFDSNPAGCPAASRVGIAVAHTPILTGPVTGPAYLVSHGGAAFPDLVVVLQGEGVTFDLVGITSIKHNVTTSTFASVPDAPVSSFELNLPQGQYSALAAIGNLCSEKLEMPTEFVAQNGATLSQNTHLEAQGCPNTLSVTSKKLHGHTLTLTISVPSAGKLTASAKGLSSTSKTSSGRGTIVVKLHVNKRGKFTTTVKLTFKPGKGPKLSKSLNVTA